MRLSLTTTLRGDDLGLLGRDYEYAPYLVSSITWGPEVGRRVTVSAPLSLGSEGLTAISFRTPHSEAPLNGDEAVWVKLMAKSRYSGIEAIDELNEKHGEYDVQCGTARVLLSDLLEAAATKTPIALDMIDPLLTITFLRAVASSDGKPPTAAQEQEIARKVYKGTVVAVPIIESGSGTAEQALALSAKLRQREREPRDLARGDPLVYGSPQMLEKVQEMQAILTKAYIKDFVGIEDSKGKIVSQPTYPLGAETSVANLHLPGFMSDYGYLPPIGMTQHTLSAREPFYKTASAPLPPFKPSKASALLFDRILGTACLSKGLSARDFTDEVRAQHTQSHSDPTLRSGYIAAKEVTVKAATNIANEVRYMADMRYPNVRYATFPSSSSSAPAASPPSTSARSSVATVARAAAGHFLNERNWRLQSSARLGVGASVLLGEGGGSKEETAQKASQPPSGPSVELECLFPVALYGIASTDDCDGSGCTAATVLRHLPALASVASREEAPLLHAAAEIAQRHFAMEIACSVSAAYVDASGKKLSRDALKKMQDLPMIGDEFDKRGETGGHAPALWLSRAVVTQMIQAALNGDRDKFVADLPQLAGADYAAWEYREPILVAEGTASIESTVIPVGEIARALFPDATTRAPQLEEAALRRKALVKSLIPVDEKAPKNALIEHMHLEGLNFYATPQDKKRRSSTFYRGVSLGLSPELYAMNPLYGQLNFVSSSSNSLGASGTWLRGCEFGELLRTPLNATPSSMPTVGLVPTFKSVSSAQWNMIVRPVLAVTQNQMPVMNLLSFDGDQNAVSLAQLRIGHILTPASLKACASLPIAMLGEAFDRHALGQLRLNNTAGARRTARETLSSNNTALTSVAGISTTGTFKTRPTTLNVYMRPWKLAKPGVAEAVINELEALKKAKRITSYTAMSNRPLLNGEDVITFILTL